MHIRHRKRLAAYYGVLLRCVHPHMRCRYFSKSQLYSQNGVFARAVSSGIANIRLYCVSQGIHPGSSGYERWQAYCNFRIQNRISRNQREVINRIFVASMGVCDDCRQCRFASGAGGGRYRHQKRELFVYFQKFLSSWKAVV